MSLPAPRKPKSNWASVDQAALYTAPSKHHTEAWPKHGRVDRSAQRSRLESAARDTIMRKIRTGALPKVSERAVDKLIYRASNLKLAALAR